MSATDLLVAIAQIAVALAGFSGLIAAIRTASPEGWHPRDIWSLAWMLGASVGALILALLPPWLMLVRGTEASAYQWSSAVACAYMTVFGCAMAWRGWQLTRGGYPPRVPLIPSAIGLLLVVATLATGAGAAGWLRLSLVPAYVGSLLALLLVSALVLAIFLVLLARSAQRK